MLVLTRKLGEKILIGDDITITVVDIGKSRMKVGIEAPAGHRILRSELLAGSDPAANADDADAGAVRTEIAASKRSLSRWVARQAEAVGA